MRRPFDAAYLWGVLVVFSLLRVHGLAQITQLHSPLPVGFATTSGVGEPTLTCDWDAGGKRRAQMEFNLGSGHLIKAVALAEKGILSNLDPFLSITTGTRESPPGRPPEMSIWNTFFDNPAKRPRQTHVATFAPRAHRIERQGEHRASVVFGGVTAGPFSGDLRFTVYSGSPLVQVECVMTTQQDKVAFVFSAGLLGNKDKAPRCAWLDTDDRWQFETLAKTPASDIAVKHRSIFAQGESGSLALFPAPHQFFYPVDYTTNNRTAWCGLMPGDGRHGFGIRQDEHGGGNFVPWCNAPPGTKQRLGYFLLLDAGDEKSALRETMRYTRGDRFAALPGQTTFTSHYHMAIAVEAIRRAAEGKPPVIPEFVKVFKDMGVSIVHLGEFHGDGHPRDPGPLRLPEMKAMFDECARLSDDTLTLIPGEEGNDYLGIREIKKHPGHWMSLFPRPVYWTMVRAEGQPLFEKIEPYGTVYHVGSRADMMELLQKENGLTWTAHPRIKASNWTPDIFRREDFYLSDRWLGAAYKSMPVDLSREKLGERCLDLLSDMANWGQKKYLPGEVDVFKIDHTHELYGHMNINYLRLPRAPRYSESWQPVLDALSRGAFFTTTGEVLVTSFTLGGKQSGETVKAGETAELKADLEWTFPLEFAEIISGDGAQVFRQRIDLRDTGAHEKRTLFLKPDITGRKWLRLEVWDIARNGAYTQLVWIEP